MLSILQGKEQLAAKPSSKELIKSFLGGSLSILLLLALSHWTGHIYLMAPFGATCVLLYAVSRSPLAQPRNVIFGHFVSALVGLLALKLFSASAFSMAIAVGAAICLMQFLRCVHPPAGANPLVILLTADQVMYDWSFLVFPVLLGSITLVIVAMLINNIGRAGK